MKYPNSYKKRISVFSLFVLLLVFSIQRTSAEEDSGALDDLSIPEDLQLSNDAPKNPEPERTTNEATVEQPKTPVAESTAPPQMNLEMSAPPDTSTNVSSGSVSSGGTGQNEITNLEFKMEGTTSRILVSSRGRLNYRESKNTSLKQVVYFFENTTTQQRLERAYDTTEFVSPVALFTLLQVPKSNPPQTKLIVQLREDKFPTLTNSERGLYVDFPAPEFKQEPKLLTSDENRGATEENIYNGNQAFTGKRIKRLEVKNSDVQDVIRLIAKSSGYSVVIGDDVTGKVGTLSVENIPWDQAFTLVLQSKKLGYIKQGNVLRVATLAALKSEKEEALATENSKLRVEALRTVIIPISYAKAADMATRAKSFLSERGSADADTRSNTVIVKDVDKNVVRIQKLFSVLDSQPPKVSVSAKFVEMSSKFARIIGLQHSFSAHMSGIDVDPILGSPLIRGGSTDGSNVSALIKAANFANLQTQLRLGESDEKVKVLASPTLAINSNQKGSIQHGTNYTIVVPVVSSTGSGVTYQPITVTANLTLDVTPIVAGDGSISMDVKIQNDVAQPPTPTNINVDTRKVETQVIVENGDTIVIGGVFKDSVTTKQDGFPWLMHIPILGYLLSGHSNLAERSEILVFLTPKILNVDEAFKRSL